MKEVDIPEIGRVQLDKNGRAKRNFNIRIKNDGVIYVSIPPGQSYQDAQRVLYEMKDRIQKQQARLMEQPTQKTIGIGSIIKTHHHRIEIKREHDRRVAAQGGSAYVALIVPDEYDISAENTQKGIRLFVEGILRDEAKAVLPERVWQFAAQHNLNPQSVRITSAKTRWGSCSSKNKLNFSLYLMMLPDELIDYIILHELAHTVHKNHGPHFYALLDNMCDGRHDELNRRLKTHRLGVL
ncbi:MAG: M48 family metallopeptidase [Bacteroidales bacterium]